MPSNKTRIAAREPATMTETQIEEKTFRDALVSKAFKILSRRKRPTETGAFFTQLFEGTELAQDEYRVFHKRVQAQISSWRKRGWIAGEIGKSYLWAGPSKITDVIAE